MRRRYDCQQIIVRTKKSNALYRFTGTILLSLIFLALFVPTTYQPLKIVLLIISLIGVVLLAVSSSLVWSPVTLIALLAIAIFGLLNSVHGILNSAPGAVSVLTIMTVWPILYSILSSMLNRPDALRILFKSLSITLVAIIVYSYLFIGSKAGIVSDMLYFELDCGQKIGFFDGVVEYNLYSISSLLFLMPFWVHHVFDLIREKKSKLIHWAVLLFGLVLCVLTGRRALLMVIILVLFISLMSMMLVDGEVRKVRMLFGKLFNINTLLFVVFCAIIMLYALSSMGLSFDSILEYFEEGFDFSANQAASERSGQFSSLMNAWLDNNILFGSGNGSHTSYLRSSTMPWAYELTYIYLLFSTGIVGVFVYFGWFGWGLLRVRYALAQRPDMAGYVAPLVTGTFGLAIGAASNPYFGKFDFLWIIMLPHIIAGAIKHQRYRKI